MLKAIQKMVTPLMMMGWSLYYFLEVSKQNPQSQYLIRPVFYAVVLLFFLIMGGEFRRLKAERQTQGEGGAGVKLDEKTKKELEVLGVFVGGAALYLLLLPYVGFIIATPVFLLAAFLYLKSSKITAAILAVGLTAFIYIAFKILLGVPLPAGLLGI